jgi:hypothetical protein
MMVSSSPDLYLCERASLVDNEVGRTREHDGYLGMRVVGYNIVLTGWLVVDGAGGVCECKTQKERRYDFSLDPDPYGSTAKFQDIHTPMRSLGPRRGIPPAGVGARPRLSRRVFAGYKGAWRGLAWISL